MRLPLCVRVGSSLSRAEGHGKVSHVKGCDYSGKPDTRAVFSFPNVSLGKPRTPWGRRPPMTTTDLWIARVVPVVVLAGCLIYAVCRWRWLLEGVRGLVAPGDEDE